MKPSLREAESTNKSQKPLFSFANAAIQASTSDFRH